MWAQNYEPYEVTTIAGTTNREWSTPDGLGPDAAFAWPTALAIEPSGNLFVADLMGGQIRMMSREGTNWMVSTLAHAYTQEPMPLNAAGFVSVGGFAMDRDGALYVADSVENNIFKATHDGTNWTITTIVGAPDLYNPGSADGTNADARFNNMLGLTVDDAGIIYICDAGNHTIRKAAPVGTNWVVTTIAGLAGAPGYADGTNSDARFYYPGGVAHDGEGNLYVSDQNHTIRKLRPEGTNWVVKTIAGKAQLYLPGVLGEGSPRGGYADGRGTEALFNCPGDMVWDSAGNLYISDVFNHAIRKLSPVGSDWMVTTLAGHPPRYGLDDATSYNQGGFADGIGANARFYMPGGLAMGAGGELYIADEGNSKIRMAQMVPSLHCVSGPGQVIVSWPTSAVGFVLETKTDPGPVGTWTPLTNNIVVSGTSCFYTNELSPNSAFFRLCKP